MSNKDWKRAATILSDTGTLSWRGIAKALDVPRSTVSDFLRKRSDTAPTPSVAASKTDKGITHLVIPDSQVRPGISLDYLRWIGEYIVRKRPDVIIHLGDFADFESLSSYDKGKKSAEGKRLQADIDAALLGMYTLLLPLQRLQFEQMEAKEYNPDLEIYQPRMVLTLGNHEDRLTRHINSNPELHGFLDMSALRYEEFGWEVVPFLTPVNVNGVNYVHYMPNVMTGKALTGTAANMLKTVGETFIMGHRQVLDVATRFLPASGKQQWCIVAGAGYEHDEEYKGACGNHHWRGILVLHNVSDGSFDPLFVSLDWLKGEYGK